MAHQDLLDDLLAILGPKGLLTETADITPFTTDFRQRRTGAAIAVVQPATTEQTAQAISAITRKGLAVFPQGGNTGLCYGAVPQNGVVVSLKRLRKLREADATSGLLSVDAGMTLSEVHEEVDKLGFQFPLYLGSQGTAQIGGLISTNAGGTGVLRYGAMRDLIAGVELVLPDGRILSEMEGLRKNNTGYNLTQLTAGAEGTLGIVTGAVLRLSPKMLSRAHAWLGFDNISAALEVAQSLKSGFGSQIEALELLDRNQVTYVVKHVHGVRMPLSATPEYSLLIELASSRSGDDLTPQLEAGLYPHMETGLIIDGVVAQNETQAKEIWHFRHSVTEANKLNGVGVVLDTSVRPSEIENFVSEADRISTRCFPEAERCIVAHLADGNVHFIVMFPHDLWNSFPDAGAKELEVEKAIHDAAAAVGGTFSAEHGIGRKLTDEMERLIDPVRLDVMRSIKKALDPKGLMNPGALLPPAS